MTPKIQEASIKGLLVLFIFPSLSWAKTVILLGQWHLLPDTMTNHIEKSRELPQFTNQKAIYLVLEEWIKAGKVKKLVAEGCEGLLDQNFSQSYNGWTYQKLAKRRLDDFYPDIMTLIPLKLEAKYQDKVKTVCGDDHKLIKEHQLIFSQLRAYLGFYFRLKESKNGSKKYQGYHRGLEQVEKKKVKDPVAYSLGKARNYSSKEKAMIKKRNQKFIDIIKESREKVLAVVIGSRHLNHLEKELTQSGHQVLRPQVIEDTLPPQDDDKKLNQLLTAGR